MIPWFICKQHSSSVQKHPFGLNCLTVGYTAHKHKLTLSCTIHITCYVSQLEVTTSIL